MAGVKVSAGKSEGIVFFFAAAAGIFLRVFNLGGASAGPYEYEAARIAAEPGIIKAFFTAAAEAPHPPLFYMFEYTAGSVFGVSEISLRIIPVLFGIFNMFLFHKMTRSFFSAEVSMAAMAAFALNPLQVFYARQAAVFVIFGTFSLFVIYYFLISVKYNSFTMKPFIFWSMAGLYTHHGAVLLFAALNAVFFVMCRNEIRVKQWLKAQGVIVLLWLPVLPLFLKDIQAVFAEYRQGILAPFFTIKNFIFGPFIEMSGWITAALVAAVFFIIMGATTRRRPREKKVIDIIAFISFFSAAVVFACSLAFNTRYSDSFIIYAGCMAVIIFIVGISYLYPGARKTAAVLLAVIYIVSYTNYFSPGGLSKVDYKRQVIKVKQGMKKNDIILHTSEGSYRAFEFYAASMKGADIKNFLFGGKEKNKEKPGFWSRAEKAAAKKFGVDIKGKKSVLYMEDIKGLLSKRGRIWVVADTLKGKKKNSMAEPAVMKYGVKKPSGFSEIKNFWPKTKLIVEEKYVFKGTDIYLLRRQ